MTDLVKVNEEINNQFANPEVVKGLLTHTFKGLTIEKAREAALEARMRGFEFKDFLEKNVYAIPYGSGYSLVSSIDHARKIGMKSGVIGTMAPVYEMAADGKTIISCSVTVKRRIGEDIGEFTALVYFDEYVSSKSIWREKPRTMIAKVAEMHALRKACPEELAQAYVEEEMEKGSKESVIVNVDLYREKLMAVVDMQDLMNVWASLPATAKTELSGLKDSLKLKYGNANG